LVARRWIGAGSSALEISPKPPFLFLRFWKRFVIRSRPSFACRRRAVPGLVLVSAYPLLRNSPAFFSLVRRSRNTLSLVCRSFVDRRSLEIRMLVHQSRHSPLGGPLLVLLEVFRIRIFEPRSAAGRPGFLRGAASSRSEGLVPTVFLLSAFYSKIASSFYGLSRAGIPDPLQASIRCPSAPICYPFYIWPPPLVPLEDKWFFLSRRSFLPPALFFSVFGVERQLFYSSKFLLLGPKAFISADSWLLTLPQHSAMNLVTPPLTGHDIPSDTYRPLPCVFFSP